MALKVSRREVLGSAAHMALIGLVTPNVAAAQSSTENINAIIKGLAPRRGQVEADGSGAGREVPLGEIKDRLVRPRVRAVRRNQVVLRDRTVFIDLDRTLDFEVYFDYDSDRLTLQARQNLDRLGKALASEALAPFDFLVAGHTDAVGTLAYNDVLSLRRARSVREHLITNYPIHPKRLVPHGFGERRLKVPSSPRSGINRRVQVALIVD